MSYTIDIYRKKLDPTNDIIAFFAFVSFFPQLVAGPIERASNLLPQFFQKRKFVYKDATDGLKQILWGFFVKIVIADNCAIHVNQIFENYTMYNSGTLILGAIFFSFQIYGDFSGYSHIAIGVARIFGFNLMRNFAYPYFSRDIAEFWRRWHISLSTWFRDYVYIPLGGSKGSILNKIRNVFIIFVVSGFWHGANWTFIIWGAINALLFLPLILSNKNRRHTDIVAKGKILPSFKDIIRIGFTFIVTTFAWIFFRAENLSHTLSYISKIFNSPVSIPQIRPTNLLVLISFQIAFEWIARTKQHPLQIILYNHTLIRWISYLLIAMLIFIFGVFEKTEFIYFAF